MATVTFDNSLPTKHSAKNGKGFDSVDQFIHGTSVAAAHISIRMGFLRKVFGILSLQLLFTTFIGGVFILTPGLKGLVQQWTWMVGIGLVGSIVLLIAIFWKRHEAPLNYLLLFAWTICEAYTLGVVVSYYDQSTVVEAFFLTTCVVVVLFMYTCQTSRDFTGWGPGLFAIIWVIFLAAIIQMFLLSETLEMLLSIGGAVVFSLFIIYDLQFMMYKISAEEYIMATLTLYLDIINLFQYILRLINVLKRD